MQSGKSGAGVSARVVSLITLLILSLSAGMLAAQPAGPEQAEAAMQPTVNINEADAETIAAVLDGVGETRARAIVEYRDQHGPFASVDELREVSGIGEATVNLNKSRILLK